MSTESITNLVLSIVTTITAIIAVIISVVQIAKSNKQAMFERRLRVYLTIKWMTSLCNEQKSSADNYIEELSAAPVHSIDLFFFWMTNTSFLESIQPAIFHTMESEWQRKYLLKIEELRNMIDEANIVFPASFSSDFSDFIFYYEEMLVHMYKYQIAIKSIAEECEKGRHGFPPDNKLENELRLKLLKYVKGTFELGERLRSSTAMQSALKLLKL